MDRDPDFASSEYARIEQAAAFVRSRCPLQPRAAVVLGSGWGALGTGVEAEATFSLPQIPHLIGCSVIGHTNELRIGHLGGVPTCVFRGRIHLYEGYSAAEVVRPVRLARLLGAEVVILTNAAGGIREDLKVGDAMLLRDHLNLMGSNPLVGPNDDQLGERFPDMTYVYDRELRRSASEVAAEVGMELREGVYAALLGPTYETPAEIRMLRTLGADAVGMSTVPEAIAARHAGMRVLGVSCITNAAAGIVDAALSHDEVMQAGKNAEQRNQRLLEGILARFARSAAEQGGA